MVLAECSIDPEGSPNMFLPENLDADKAAIWLNDFSANIWLVEVNNEPAGLLFVHEPLSPGVPSGFLETQTYLRESFRGKGIATEAWRQVEPEVFANCRGLAGVPWESNVRSISRLRKSGFQMIKRIAFRDETSSGWCQVWIKSSEC